jgi:hypothetical protein
MQDAETSISQRVTSLAASSAREIRIPSAVCSTWDPLGVSRLSMTLHSIHLWEVAAGLVILAAVTALVLWLVFRKRPTPEELERARRQFLVQSGRIVDGMLLDAYEFAADDGRTLTMLLFHYRIGGVDYECSQDITDLLGVVDVAQVRRGFPCSVRYQPGNPQSSIVVAEQWTGLRAGLPQFPPFDDPDPLDLSHLRPGRG